MDTCLSRAIRAAPERVFPLAARVEDWPRILPHYRWVRVLSARGAGERLVDMAARRDVIRRVAVPLRWTSIQRIHPESMTIEFEHVAGVTRGMFVQWRLEPDTPAPGLTLASIRHVFAPAWPVPDALVRSVVGEYFVNGVARRTLERIAALAESGHTPCVTSPK